MSHDLNSLKVIILGFYRGDCIREFVWGVIKRVTWSFDYSLCSSYLRAICGYVEVIRGMNWGVHREMLGDSPSTHSG